MSKRRLYKVTAVRRDGKRGGVSSQYSYLIEASSPERAAAARKARGEVVSVIKARRKLWGIARARQE